MLYENSIDDKILSIMKGMNFMLGLELGKNKNIPPEFIDLKISILKYKIGYRGEDDDVDNEEK